MSINYKELVVEIISEINHNNEESIGVRECTFELEDCNEAVA